MSEHRGLHSLTLGQLRKAFQRVELVQFKALKFFSDTPDADFLTRSPVALRAIHLRWRARRLLPLAKRIDGWIKHRSAQEGADLED